MHISLVSDTTLALPVDALSAALNRLCKTIRFEAAAEPVHIQDSFIKVPKTHRRLPAALLKAASDFDEVVIGTNIPYENNSFSEGEKNISIVSFSDWIQLTDLSLENGFLYFICAGIAQRLGVPEPHEDNTGCLNDFLWDKRVVNAGMRAAYICEDCKDNISNKAELEDLNTMLELLSRASRSDRSILDVVRSPLLPEQHFDVFLCHNSTDRPSIRNICTSLKSKGVRTWFDEENLPSGLPWQPEIERQVEQFSTAAVFVGKSGVGPWQNLGMCAILIGFVQRSIPVIPVILPDAIKVPELPVFLRALTWIDLRQGLYHGVQRLARVVKSRQ